MSRKIIHLDLDAFYCAVEELLDPSLIGIPFAVGGSPQGRGVVSSCSYAARQYGIRSAMPMARAIKLCPNLISVRGHYKEYSRLSKEVMAILHTFTHLVEQISIDEAFLDVTDLPETGEMIARNIQIKIHEKTRLPCSLGVATNKLIAKIANNVGKASSRGSEPPNAITAVPDGEESLFLQELPVEALWGVGPKTATKLKEIGINTIGDLTSWSESDLRIRFGKHGLDLYRRSHGLDDRPITTSHEIKSISNETTFVEDISASEDLHKTLYKLSANVSRRLRKSNLAGTTVRLKIRWPNFTTLTRQLTLDQPSDQEDEIYNAALLLFNKVWKESNPVRLIGVGVGNLGPPIRQLSFWDNSFEKNRSLQSSIDELNERYGTTVIRRGIKS